MVADVPYLPDILKDVVTRVDARTSSLLSDPFHVYFDYGVYEQVTRNIYENEVGEPVLQTFPLVWFVVSDKSGAELHGEKGIYAEVSIDLIIAMPTQSGYTMQQRTDISFKPRLLVIYQLLMEEIRKDKRFDIPGGIAHIKKDFPYWGGGTSSNNNANNLFKKNIDAVFIQNMRITVLENCSY